jgi:hypothetical protein
VTRLLCFPSFVVSSFSSLSEDTEEEEEEEEDAELFLRNLVLLFLREELVFDLKDATKRTSCVAQR